MDTLSGIIMREKAVAANAEEMIFDWNKAADLIKQLKPEEAEAGLAGDYENTNGHIVTDGHTFLSSVWATPTLYLDDRAVPCFVYKSDNTEGWDYDTTWPRSAVEILEAKEETDRTINADELLRILDVMERDAEEHPEVGLKPAPMIRKIKEVVEALAEGGVLLEPGEAIIPVKYARGGVLRKK